MQVALEAVDGLLKLPNLRSQFIELPLVSPPLLRSHVSETEVGTGPQEPDPEQFPRHQQKESGEHQA